MVGCLKHVKQASSNWPQTTDNHFTKDTVALRNILIILLFAEVVGYTLTIVLR